MRLDVWMEGAEVPVGTLERYDTGNVSFSYDPAAGFDISISMPRRDMPYGDPEVRAFFSNLLFEGPQLDRTRSRLGIDVGDIAGLLYHIGGDCSGAISITPEGAGPGKFPGVFPLDYEELPPERLALIAASLSRTGRLPDEERSPSPLAGYQGKLALLAVGGTYYLPRPGTGAPTTHILKVSPAAEPLITTQEAALLAMGGQAGLTVAEAEAMTLRGADAAVNAILVERFDRYWEGDRIHRLHCEDLCQAIGLPPTLKYGYDAVSDDRRFTAARIGQIMERLSVPGLATQAMIDQTLFNLLVGNTDNHAKNTTILRGLSGRFEVAPLYDVVPVFMDTNVTHKLAHKIGSADYVDDVTSVGLLEMMKDLGISKPSLASTTRRMRHLVDVIQTWSEQLGGESLADALSAQMQAVEAACKLDLGVVPRGSYSRMPRDSHHISF